MWWQNISLALAGFSQTPVIPFGYWIYIDPFLETKSSLTLEICQQTGTCNPLHLHENSFLYALVDKMFSSVNPKQIIVVTNMQARYTHSNFIKVSNSILKENIKPDLSQLNRSLVWHDFNI